MPLTDRLGLDLALADTVLVQEPAQRLDHEQGRARVGGRVRVCMDDVVRCRCDGHSGNATRRLGCLAREPGPPRHLSDPGLDRFRGICGQEHRALRAKRSLRDRNLPTPKVS